MKKMNKGVATLLVSAMVTLPVGGAFAQINDYENHWASSIISSWKDQGLILGYEDGSIKPDNNITRAEFVSIVNRVLEFEDMEDIDFADVSSEAWYYKDVKKAVAAGYITGYDDDTLKPNQSISRQEAAVILAKLAGLDTENAEDVLEKFKDVKDIPQWSKDFINAVVEASYMVGYPNGNFEPTKSITRAESMKVLNTLIEIDDENDEENIDEEKSIIIGIVDGETYTSPVTPATESENIKSVVLTKDGEVLDGYNLGEELDEDGEYVLTIVDEGDVETIITFTVAIETGDNGSDEGDSDEGTEDNGSDEGDSDEGTEDNGSDDIVQ